MVARATRLAPDERLAFSIGEPGVELFTLAAVDDGIAVLGLLDAYLGPAAVESVARRAGEAAIHLRAGGQLAFWLERPLRSVAVDGRPVAPEERGGLHVVSVDAAGPAVVTVALG
jgi:hypothetical protein